MLRIALLSSALALCALPALARDNYALLIGANEYRNLDERWWLNGPKNDVALVRDYLISDAPVAFPADHVTVLADGLDGAEPATLAAIRSAFTDLTAKAQPGDFIYLHFSGHGTQAPATDDDTELDGLDELFLPVDVGQWEDSIGHVENALVDDEIGRMVDALRAKGADVWIVFDSCHSGTATRAVEVGDDDVRTRQLDPTLLGIDPALMDSVATRSVSDDPRAAAEPPLNLGPGKGTFVAFYAAQTNEVTPEKRLPKGSPDRKPQGVFTYTLFETIAEHPGATYGQLASEVLRKYAVKNLARSTPLFEGDLEAVAFSGAGGGPVAQWQATLTDGTFTLPAGELHGLAPGDRLAIMATAADPDDAAIGFANVTQTTTFDAKATPESPSDLPAGLTLRKLNTGVDFTLTIALPDSGTAPADTLLSALNALQDATGPRLTFVPAGAEADLRLAVISDSPRPDAIWILPATGLAEDLSSTPSVSTADKDGDALATTLADTLATMSRAVNLMKLGGTMPGDGLDVKVEMLTRNIDFPTLTALPFSPVPVLLPDDEVHVLARNNTDQPVDVNVLYVGADYAISHWAAERLQPGDTLKRGLFAIGGPSLGQERMIVVITPAKPQTPVENLSFLAQDALDLTRSIGTDTTSFDALMREAGFGETTRGAVPLSGGGDASGPAPMILQLELRTKAAN